MLISNPEDASATDDDAQSDQHSMGSEQTHSMVSGDPERRALCRARRK